MTPEEIVQAALMPEPDTSARQRALRRDSNLGMLMAMTGAPGISQAGQMMYRGATDELGDYNQPGQRLDQAVKRMQLLKAQRDLNTPASRADWSVIADPTRGGFVRYNKRTGQVLPVEGFAPGEGAAGAPQVGKLTEQQSKAFNAGRRLQLELPRIKKWLSEGYTPSAADSAWQANMGTVTGAVLSVPASDTGQEFYTAGRDILAAVLRKESGAAVTDDEWRQFAPLWLPWHDDTPTQRQQKIERLEDTLVGLMIEAGPQGGAWLQYRAGQAGSSKDNPIDLPAPGGP